MDKLIYIISMDLNDTLIYSLRIFKPLVQHVKVTMGVWYVMCSSFTLPQSLSLSLSYHVYVCVWICLIYHDYIDIYSLSFPPLIYSIINIMCRTQWLAGMHHVLLPTHVRYVHRSHSSIYKYIIIPSHCDISFTLPFPLSSIVSLNIYIYIVGNDYRGCSM